MMAVRGPLGSIRERQRGGESCVSDERGGSMGGRSLTLENISQSGFNGNDDCFQVFPKLVYHLYE